MIFVLHGRIDELKNSFLIKEKHYQRMIGKSIRKYIWYLNKLWSLIYDHKKTVKQKLAQDESILHLSLKKPKYWVPINDDLAELLKTNRKRDHLKFEYIFCDKKGSSFNDIKRSFKATLRRAGIQDFRFHDLRHTFASHFVMRGGSLKELQEILGHKSMTMTLRYAHLSQEHKKKAVNLLNGLTASPRNTCHKSVTFSKSLTSPLS